MKNRVRRRRIYAALKAYRESRFWMSDEEYLLEFMPPVGREFGSPDYERRIALDALAEEAKAAIGVASASIDDMLHAVGASNKRIRAMEAKFNRHRRKR